MSRTVTAALTHNPSRLKTDTRDWHAAQQCEDSEESTVSTNVYGTEQSTRTQNVISFTLTTKPS